ncbi:MAG: hypothetical protein J0I92_13370, partial [Phyllobacterium sp.]|nr:hypothetical protein [Phyllobacterium sp.]
MANVAINRLTVTNDMTSWKSSLIGKTLLRLLYVYVLFYFCSKVKRTKAAIGAMVVDFLTEGKTRAAERVPPNAKGRGFLRAIVFARM